MLIYSMSVSVDGFIADLENSDVKESSLSRESGEVIGKSRDPKSFDCAVACENGAGDIPITTG